MATKKTSFLRKSVDKETKVCYSIDINKAKEFLCQ